MADIFDGYTEENGGKLVRCWYDHHGWHSLETNPRGEIFRTGTADAKRGSGRSAGRIDHVPTVREPVLWEFSRFPKHGGVSDLSSRQTSAIG